MGIIKNFPKRISKKFDNWYGERNLSINEIIIILILSVLLLMNVGLVFSNKDLKSGLDQKVDRGYKYLLLKLNLKKSDNNVGEEDRKQERYIEI